MYYNNIHNSLAYLQVLVEQKGSCKLNYFKQQILPTKSMSCSFHAMLLPSLFLLLEWKKYKEIKHDNLEHLELVNLLGTFKGNEFTKSNTVPR